MTQFPELDALLAEFVAGAQSELAGNFVGAYLTGSFALGDADLHSDVDFLVVTERALDADEQARLQRLHERLYERETHWAQHLEGSYVPKDELRKPAAEKWFYFDNGSTQPEWDTHCNTAVVRWGLRERGVVLAGPDPRELVDPVLPDTLRAEARATLAEYGAWAHEPQERFASGMSRWKQPYLILTLCRALHTIETGAVGSKREAGEWAVGAFGGEWAELIERALADRPEPWLRVHQDADPATVASTIDFADHVVAEADHR